MATLLKLWGLIWLGAGLWILWRTVGSLSGLVEAVQPVGSRVVSQQVVSTALIFVVPGLLAVGLGVALSPRRGS